MMKYSKRKPPKTVSNALWGAVWTPAWKCHQTSTERLCLYRSGPPAGPIHLHGPSPPAWPWSTCQLQFTCPWSTSMAGPTCTALGPPAGSGSPVPGPPARPRPPAWPRSACMASVCLYSSSSHEKREML